MSDASSIVLNAVRSVFQTYVETLKKEGNFNKDAQAIALTKAKDIALNEMSEDVKEFIRNNYGTLDTWLTTQIEASINLLKN